MEEWIGEKWHNYVVGKSSKSYPDSRVRLEDFKSQLGVLFRALGGDKSFSIESSSALRHGGYRRFLQKISGSGDKVELAHFGSEHLYLPAEICNFKDPQLNKDLYIWLTAIASLESHENPNESWILRNQKLTQSVLSQWPGLRSKYDQLVQAQLQQRLEIDQLPLDLHALETVIINSLEGGDHTIFNWATIGQVVVNCSTEY